MKRNWIFIILLSMAALSLGGTAAYFSVYGLTKLFAAAGIGITILAASLEFAKLITVSYVYRFWKNIKKGLRFFYVFAVVFIMLLTSIGIYGFLTGAYQQSANKIQLRDAHIQIADNKRKLFVDQLDRINKSIQNSNDRINTLSGIRSQQENRLDNLYNQNYVSVAKRTETQITGSDDQIKILNNDITDKMRQTTAINDSIGFYDQRIAELKNSDISNEIGPYKFVADITGLPIDRIVNIVAILIILVFDPLAIALLIGINQLTFANSPLYKNEEKKIENTSDNIEPPDNSPPANSPLYNNEEKEIEKNIITKFFKKKDTEIPIIKTEESKEEVKTEVKEAEEVKEKVAETITELEEVKEAEDVKVEVTEIITELEEVIEQTENTMEEKIEYQDKVEEVQQVEEKFAEFVINSEVDDPSITAEVAEKVTEIIENEVTENEVTENEVTENVVNEVTESEVTKVEGREVADESVKSFLDVFDHHDDYQARKVASTKGRVNVAHFVPKE